jgi:hypothetical protein
VNGGAARMASPLVHDPHGHGLGKEKLTHPLFSPLAPVGFFTGGNRVNGGAARLASLHIHDLHGHGLGKEMLTYPLFSPLTPVGFFTGGNGVNGGAARSWFRWIQMILCLGIGKGEADTSSVFSVSSCGIFYRRERSERRGCAASLHIHDSHSHLLGKEMLTHPLFSPLAPVRALFSQWEGIFSISSFEIRTELIAIRLE